MKKKNIFKLVVLVMVSLTACKKSYLDVVPDNVPTVNNAFTMQSEAEKYLATCYAYLPNDGDPFANPAYVGGDELWMQYPSSVANWNIARGSQNVTAPYGDVWLGMYQGIRDCNVFLDNVSDLSKVSDLDIDTRTRWLGEVMFLKAYYHFLLLRQYGPVPVVDKNLPINVPLEQTKVKRQPVDSVVNYIVNLLDQAAAKLPNTVLNPATDDGHITRPIALSIKARVLVYAASPLFNGNADYSNFKGKDGQLYFNQTLSLAKWQRAADAAKAAITACEAVGIQLYQFPGTNFHLSDTTLTEMSIRNAMTEKYNSEAIWTNSNSSTFQLQYSSMAHIDPSEATNTSIYGTLGPPLKVVEQFYTRNGVPINEDNTLDYSNISQLRSGTHAERFDNIENYPSARLNFDREPRFYADLGFDGSIWYMQNSPSNTDENTWTTQVKTGLFGSFVSVPITTYFPKKVVNWKFTFSPNNSDRIEVYPFINMRLADLYLLYAEASNEAIGPNADAFLYIDKVRARAGLAGVQTSWSNFSTNPSKFSTKDGLRSIIQQERNIEMCFEGSRFWDLRRWKLAAIQLNSNITGWDRTQSVDHPELFYKVTTFFPQTFVAPRDYLWPINENELQVNENLVQNPGW